MLSKTLAAVGLLGLMASPAMAANFMQINLPPAPNAPALSNGNITGSLSGGTIILNLQSGSLTGCPNGSNPNHVPLGDCRQIGVMDITGVNASSTNIGVSLNGTFAFITNFYTGFTAICTAITSFNPAPPAVPTNAVFDGSCVARGPF